MFLLKIAKIVEKKPLVVQSNVLVVMEFCVIVLPLNQMALLKKAFVLELEELRLVVEINFVVQRLEVLGLKI